MDFVDPLLLAGEPLQALAHPAVLGQFAQMSPGGPHWQPCCCQCSSGGLMDSCGYPACRLKICDIFSENAERARTMSQPASCAACFNSP